ncbi:MAG: hypothetical protein ACRDKW_03215 [Actinomycetota bacterium]
MGHFSEPSDEDLDRLLSGLAPAGDGFDELAALVRDVQSACSVTLDGAAEDRHVMPIVAAAQLIEPEDTVAPRSRRRTSGLPAWRRRTVFGSLFASLTAKIAGVAVASTVAAGGFAATGTLPDPAQTAVANVVEKVGITIPNPEKAEEKAAEKAAEAADKAAKAEEKAADKAAKAEEKAAKAEEKAAKAEDGEDGATNGKSVAEDVHKALEQEYESGREKGDAVSDAASQNRQNDKGEAPGAPEGDQTTGTDTE